jgi:hypothetical protein
MNNSKFRESTKHNFTKIPLMFTLFKHKKMSLLQNKQVAKFILKQVQRSSMLQQHFQ